jgi:hypothetical protein
MRLTTVDSASSTIFLSALPKRTPRMSQSGSRRDFEVLGSTMTERKPSQEGEAFLTASAIASSSSAGVIELRWSVCHQLGLRRARNRFAGGLDAPPCEAARRRVSLNVLAFSMAQEIAQDIAAPTWPAARRIAPPLASSCVTSCKISETSAIHDPKIKIQANIKPTLRRLQPRRRATLPHEVAARKSNPDRTR